jgi:zinc transport system substrate-binding protein
MWPFERFWLMGILLVWPHIAYGVPPDGKPVLGASTTMIASLLQDIGGKDFTILTYLPPASCPGHFDLKPSDVQLLRRTELIIYHPYQQALQKALKQHVAPDHRWLVLPEEKPLTIPVEYIKMGRYLLLRLAERFPERASILNLLWSKREEEVHRLQDEMRMKFQAQGASSFPTIVSFHQKAFVEFWGFPVVGAFDEPDGTSVQKLGELIQNGRKTGARAIIGNLQSGDRQAAFIAKKIGIPLVVLSNFPGAEPGTASYLYLLRTNAFKLLRMLE